nr:hypothetical protein [Pirellula staleyi]
MGYRLAKKEIYQKSSARQGRGVSAKHHSITRTAGSIAGFEAEEKLAGYQPKRVWWWVMCWTTGRAIERWTWRN